MKKFEATIKEKNGSVLHPSYEGDDTLTVEFLEEFWGVHEDDVESYEIHEVTDEDSDEEIDDEDKPFQLTNPDEAETIEIKLDKEKFPVAYANKKKELMTTCGMTDSEAEKFIDETTFVMELFYQPDRGLFLVESEAVESTEIYSPYTGEVCDCPDE